MYEEQQSDLDVIEGIDEDGNQILLQVMEYFFYNGEEYVLLAEADDHPEDEDEQRKLDHEDEEIDVFIMKVITSTGEDGEELEEFLPVDDDLMETLIEVVNTNFSQDTEVEG